MDEAGRCRCRLLAALRQIQFRNDDDSFRVSIRKLTEKNCVNHAENRHASPNAERQREHRHLSKAWILPQLSEGEFEIIHTAAPPLDRPSPRAGRAANSPELS